jgi:hypothetical protein
MDDERNDDWRALSAYLANAAHRLELTVVKLAADPNLPEGVRRSPAFLAAVQHAEVVGVFLERWRKAEREARADVVFRVGPNNATVTFHSEHARAWLFANLPPGSTWFPNDGVVKATTDALDQLVRDAEADGITVVLGGEA